MRTEGDVHPEGGVRLHYYRAGGDHPPVVLVHGFTDNGLYWTRTIEALAPEWDVIAYDARGHGRSDRAGGRFGDAERVGDLVGLTHALGLEKPALVGHSMGAGTIALAAAQYPDLPRCIVLEDPAWRELPPAETPEQKAGRQAQQRAYLDDWRESVRRLQAGTREQGLAEVRAHSPGWSEVDQNLSLDARLQVELDLFNYFPTERMEWRSVVAKIECPALLVLGSDRERGAIVTAAEAEEAARLWRQGRWAQVEGAGHAIRYDQFERYLGLVQPFLREAL